MNFAMRQVGVAALAAGVLTLGLSSGASAQRKLSFAYDQPVTTAYGIAANVFDEKLKALSGGKLSINQFPGAQLGTEPQTLQKLRAGDIDFVITATANAASVAPQAGVFSLHFIFHDENHLAKALAENGVNVYEQNKHYEVAPVLNMTQHEANNNCIWVSDKAWNSFSAEEKKWVQEAADEVSRREPAMAFKLEAESAAKLQKIGVKI